MDIGWENPSAPSLPLSGTELIQQTLSHLTPYGIPGAEEKNLIHPFIHVCQKFNGKGKPACR
jgi:hypothetical protein